jgi:hypothetical protein
MHSLAARGISIHAALLVKSEYTARDVTRPVGVLKGGM